MWRTKGGALTDRPKSWLKVGRHTCRSSILRRVFRMAWMETSHCRCGARAVRGTCFCHWLHTSQSWLKKHCARPLASSTEGQDGGLLGKHQGRPTDVPLALPAPTSCGLCSSPDNPIRSLHRPYQPVTFWTYQPNKLHVTGCVISSEKCLVWQYALGTSCPMVEHFHS